MKAELHPDSRPSLRSPPAANKIVDNSQYATVEGLNVTAHIDQGKVFFNHAQVISANNFASNVRGAESCRRVRTEPAQLLSVTLQGVAHIIDEVLLPVNWTQAML